MRRDSEDEVVAGSSQNSAGPLGHDTAGLLSPAEREALIGAGTLVSFDREAVIYHEAEPAEHVYWLEAGIVRASRLLPQGYRQLVAFLWPGDLFGLSENGRYLSSLEAVTAISLYRVPLAALEAVLHADARLALDLAIRTAHELRVAQGHILCLGQMNVPRRVSRFLLDCAERPDLFDRASSRLMLPMKRQDMADYLGTSVEAVARALTRLERLGLIRRLARRDVAIPDLSLLEAFVERTDHHC